MCGIAGIISSTQTGSQRHASLGQMLNCLAHRGPDADGIWEKNSISLGHKRLSIIDLSSEANQPMSDSKGHTLIFNGMIYNYKELRKEIESLGGSFKSQSDTEVLLQGYALWGEAILQKIKGFFAFALFDEKKNQLFCARDPFGKKPFYYYQQGNQFFFASEIQALIVALEKKPALNIDDLSHYLWKGFYPYTQTAYQGVRTLKPGHSLIYDLNKQELKESAFESIGFELGESSNGSVLEECSNLLERSVQRRLQSDVPLGVLLSGGVDSSLVSILSAEKSSLPIETFNISFEDKSFDESLFAQQVAKKIGSKHKKIRVQSHDLPAMLEKMVSVYGEPFGDPSTIPTFKVFEAIPSQIKVALTGDGGDEVFAGYEDMAFYRVRTSLALIHGLGNVFGDKLPFYLARHPSRVVRRIGYLFLMMQKEGGAVFELLFSTGWTRYWRHKCMRPEIWGQTAQQGVEQEERIKFLQAGRSDSERYLNRMFERLSQAYLMKVDRASMAHSIEARSPLLDLDLFHWAKGLSLDQLVNSGKSKTILKTLLDQKMGSAFSDRPKQGFTPPLVQWLAEPKNRSWIEQQLLDKQGLVYSLFEPRRIKQMIDWHCQGKHQTERLWNLLFLNEWHKKYGT